MEQVPGVGMFVAADRLAGGAVDMSEPADPTPTQHLMRGRCGAADPGGDLDRSQTLLPAQMHDLAHHRCRGRSRTVVGAAGPVGHAGLALGAVAGGPPVGGGPGDLEPLGGAGDRPAVLDDQTRQA
jgi:hypothetical protein